MWLKKGLIFNSSGNFEWNKSHAQVPVIDVLDDKLRIYYSARNSKGKSNISYIETRKDSPSEILYKHDRPILNFGAAGTFDDSGQMPTCILNIGSKKYLYYIGWTERVRVPYSNSIGLAISEDGGLTFEKLYEGPILGVTKSEPYFVGTAFVITHDNQYIMWYLSCVGWKKIDNKMEPFYDIKIARSNDAVNWERKGEVAINLREGEGGIASASVIYENSKYKMWYGVRQGKDYRTNNLKSYRIGFAESKNGLDWERDDSNSGIEVSEKGWDSEMISYPYIVKVNEDLLMFYNGNGFGVTGFGFAKFKKNTHSNDF
tara:strand:- start:304 stop:1251 length:948 start_codon:yes stop_codon:yes gene_type:complete